MTKILKNRYELLTELGRGGMSTVYLARDLNLGSYWAVKHMKNNGSNEIIAFKQEVELLAGLSHPDIPRIVDRIEEFDDYYVVMDFVDGVSLGKKVVAEGPVDEATVIGWSKMLCSILTYLHTVHENPIVYRDMKPDNIILAQSGRVKLIDFGIAKECVRGVKDEGECFGTRGYAAPEQYRNGSNILDERTDVYSLGCTMFYLLTGKVPGKAPNACPPLRTLNPNLSDGIHYIVSKDTSDDPNARYADCEQMYEDLEHIAELSSEYKEKMRKRVFSFILCLIAAVIFAGVGIWGYVRIKDDMTDKFQYYYDEGCNYSRKNEHQLAAENFKKAIEYNPDDYDAYEKWFNALLSQGDIYDDDANELNAMLAVDQMCRQYIDVQNSPMHNEPRLMYLVAKNCVQFEQPGYNEIAIDYLEKIQKDPDFINGKYKFSNIDLYLLLAKTRVSSTETINYMDLGDLLVQLWENTQTEPEPYDRLFNCYTLIEMFNHYSKLDGYEELWQDIGAEAQEIYNTNSEYDNFGTNDDLAFNLIVWIYKDLANCNGRLAKETNEIDHYLRAIEWVDQLEIFSIFDPEFELYKADWYMDIVRIRSENKPVEDNSDATVDYLGKAIKVYKELIEREEDRNVKYEIKLGIAYAELAHMTNDEKALDNAMKLYEEFSVMKLGTNQQLFGKFKYNMSLYGYIDSEEDKEEK